MVGYYPPEGTEWEEAGLFEELAISPETDYQSSF
jgi:hypothetical protein